MSEHPFTLTADQAGRLVPTPHPTLNWDAIQAVIEELAREGLHELPRAWPADMDRTKIPLAMVRLKTVLVPLGYEVSLTATGFMVSWRDCLPHQRFESSALALDVAAGDGDKVVFWCPICGGWHCLSQETYARLEARWTAPGRPSNLDESFLRVKPSVGRLTQANVLEFNPREES